MPASNTGKAMSRHMGQIDPSRERHFYELIVDHMRAAGYVRNSAWCFSRRPGMSDEYIVDHEEYVGLGSGSFSYLQGSIYASTFSINHYAHLLTSGRTGTVQRRRMSERDQMRYFLMMRLFSGSLDQAAAEQRFASRFGKVMWKELSALRLIGAVKQTTD